MTKFRLSYAEFYITNVCNLTCQGCNRFNNYKFSGFERWTDMQDIYGEWAKQFKIDTISILGGEPLLNPEFMLWLQGVMQLWPASNVMIGTNGYQLNKIQGFYDFVLPRKNQIQINIGIHNKQKKSFIIEQVHEFLTAPFTHEFNQDNPYHEYMWITDANGVRVKVEYNWWFHQGALVPQPGDMKFTLHQSDPVKAHDICHSKTCHHFMGGRLYKCGEVALFPEFDRQYPMELTAEDHDLMTAYRPLAIDDTDEFKQQFVDNLPNAIDQCKFCPEQYHGDQIFAEEKKVVFRRERETT
jgi:hypothetical protein